MSEQSINSIERVLRDALFINKTRAHALVNKQIELPFSSTQSDDDGGASTTSNARIMQNEVAVTWHFSSSLKGPIKKLALLMQTKTPSSYFITGVFLRGECVKTSGDNGYMNRMTGRKYMGNK